ncbi:MAG: UDP-glucose 4-epimerase GalE [Pseudomonadota bacterium]|jgi:UDP-glucose 4-epimerase
MKRTVLVTGGTGYIGAHTAVVFMQAGYQVVVLDNLSNSSADAIDRIAHITGLPPEWVCADVRDADALQAVFARHRFDGVVHLAGLKAVGESVQDPLTYYDHNVHGSLQLMRTARAHGVSRFVFSSSATVYGEPQYLPYDEAHPADHQTNPYGRTKRMVEIMLEDAHRSDPSFRVAVLRYFNPIGAHESGWIGENPKGTPNNLLPYVTRVALGHLAELSVYGNDYPTPDGTGRRDYIHVMDLTEAHLKAYEALTASDQGFHVWNLGTGTSTSVMEIIQTFEAVTGQRVPYRIAPRRDGDIPECYASTQKAQLELGWRARRSLQDMVRDAWHWETRSNPTPT